MKQLFVKTLFLVSALLMQGVFSQAFAQGSNALIQDELLGLADETKLHGSINTSAWNNQDEYSDGFYSVRTQLTYELDKRTQAYMDWSYLSPFSQAEEAVRRFGAQDLSAGLTRDLYSYKDESGLVFSMLGIGELTAPISRTSQYAGMRGGGAAGLVTNTVYKRFILSTNHFAIYNNYEFETANALGTQYNNAWWLNNGVRGTWLITRKLNTGIGYSYWYSQNFAGTSTPIQSINGSFTWIARSDLTASVFFVWRDRILTNNAMFDDDTTRTGASLRYIF